MKCVVCHSENIQTQSVIEEIHKGHDIIQVRMDVPVCNSCGERYYDRRTMRELEDVRASIRADTASLSQVGKVLTYNR
jgi:YgiT-type zinc finger domain-containing protein